jgi:hypothetical protein
MLTQAEADQLMQMVKHFVRDPGTITIPPGADDTYELAGPNDRERFLLDVGEERSGLRSFDFRTGCELSLLVRLDIDGAPHTNPDGHRLSGTHLHLFRDCYDDRWALPLDPPPSRCRATQARHSRSSALFVTLNRLHQCRG